MIALLYFFSGFAVLSYQVLWSKILSQTLGVDAVSTVLSICVVLLGLGFGGAWGGLISAKTSRPLRWFLAFEAAMALFGCLSEPLLRAVGAGLNSWVETPESIGILGLEAAVNGLCLLPATLLMGAALPLLTRVIESTSWGVAVGRLQGAAVWGGAVGVLLTGFFFIGTWGVRHSLWAVSGLQLCIALAAAVLLLPREKKARPLHSKSVAVDWKWIGVCGLQGYVSIAFQLLYLRWLGYYFSSTSYAVWLTLGLYLIHLATGSAFAAWQIARGRTESAVRWAPVGFFLSSTIVFIAPSLLPKFKVSLFVLALLSTANERQWTLAVCLGFLFLIPIFFLSMVFPFAAQRALGANSNHGSVAFGRLLLAQGVGSFLAGLSVLFLVPKLGIVHAFQLHILAAAILWWLLWPVGKRGVSAFTPVAVATLVALSTMSPSVLFEFKRPRSYVARVYEEAGGTFFVDKGSWYHYYYRMGGEPVTEQREKDRDRRLYPLDLALVLTPERPIRKVLIVGLGPGDYPIFLRALFPSAQIDVVDLFQSVPLEMQRYGTPLAQESLKTWNIRILDGRRFLNTLHGAGGYDLIQIGTLHPFTAGAGNLYTVEAIRMVEKNLAPQGVAIIQAFPPAVRSALGVFPSVVVTGEWQSGRGNLIASREPFRERDWKDRLKAFHAKHRPIFEEAGLRAVTEHMRYVITEKSEIERAVSDIAAQTDDLPATEYFLNQTADHIPSRGIPGGVGGVALWERPDLRAEIF